ncbi:unnamed protein product [Orchesella dallaii]|uniref:Uncharacterized protein n=1 Tax=Orchesella dallaii TaxID=48710 RepID=A0ABP1S052_9HEXA
MSKFTEGETVKRVWIIDNINGGRDLEALATEGDCTLEVGQGEEKIRLRFFFKVNEETVTTVIKDGGTMVFRHLSLWVSGSEARSPSKRLGRGIIFKVKVDMLKDDLRVSHFAMKGKFTNV